jgi:hypothetical protein
MRGGTVQWLGTLRALYHDAHILAAINSTTGTYMKSSLQQLAVIVIEIIALGVE